ncbi:MAG: hypothetical protein P9L99_01540 [Candidatus Lernaella stagnicola]|nr:hypothetical protein [Candidatus Lernaella stagnicola]
MAFGGSPREMAKAVADGYMNFTSANLRRFKTPEKLREVLNFLTVMEREVRNEIIADDDFDGTRKKHFRLGNLRKAKMVIQGFAKSRRIQL